MHQQVTACNLLPNWTNCFVMFVGGLCRLICSDDCFHGPAVNDGVEGEGVAFALESVLLHEDQFGLTTAPVVVWATGEGRPTSKKTLRLNNSQQIALSALHEAVIGVGEIPPAANEIPAGVRAVPGGGWRGRAYQRGISGSSNERARQQAFKRACEAPSGGWPRWHLG